MLEYHIASPRRFAEARVLKPVPPPKSACLAKETRSVLRDQSETRDPPTFVRVNHIVLDDHISSIDGVVLLGLAPHLA